MPANSLGIKDGKPIAGTVWETNHEVNFGRGRERFRVEYVDGHLAWLQCWRGGKWISGHAWEFEDLISTWKLISLPESIKPLLEVRQSGCICIFGRSRFCTAH